jgi:hypothetical protein
MIRDQALRLGSGRTCLLRARPLPGLPTYHVLFCPADQGELSLDEEHELFGLAQRAASQLAQQIHGDPGCYAIQFAGRCTRRRPWPHVHIVVVRDAAAKRRALVLLLFKRLLIACDRLRRRALSWTGRWHHA